MVWELAFKCRLLRPKCRRKSRKQHAEAQVVLDNESRELILAGYAFSIATEAEQI